MKYFKSVSYFQFLLGLQHPF